MGVGSGSSDPVGEPAVDERFVLGSPLRKRDIPFPTQGLHRFEERRLALHATHRKKACEGVYGHGANHAIGRKIWIIPAIAVEGVQRTLEEARSFEPGGIPVQREGMWHVLDCFRLLLSSGAWRAFAALLRIDEFRKAIIPGNESTSQLLREADEFASEHLPVTLAHALELPLADCPVRAVSA